MKLCDKIYTPVYGKDATHYLSDHSPLLESENVIVISIQELREVFHEGHKTGIGRTISQPVDNPVLENPYIHLLADINEKKRIHKQSTWGPEDKPTEEKNICNTPMCTAGHLVSMAGAIGWNLKNKYGWRDAATLIHIKAHPDFPTQNFGSIDQSNALAYIEAMAEWEETGVNPFTELFK